MLTTYETYSVINLRKILDTDKRTYSLMLTLEKLSKNPEIMSKKSYLARWPGELKEMGVNAWANFFGSDEQHMPRQLFLDDIASLSKIAEKITPIANQVIAHRQRKPRLGTKPVWNDIHNSITELDRIWCKYHLLFNQASLSSVMPVNDYIFDHSICEFLGEEKRMIERTYWRNEEDR